jgi:catechol 2,3-dioxygenase-like lactoylglutathione lyase family enzyme
MSDNKPVLRATYSHIGICVSDIERSKHFYKEALGFSESAVFDANNTVNNLLGLAGNVEMTSLMMVLDTFVIELIYFKDPSAYAAEALRPMNQLGLTHLSFTVGDVDSAAEHLVACGASLLPSTRTTVEFPGSDPTELVFCTDPDGTRIELYKPSSSLQA